MKLQCQKGQALIEAAISLPLILTAMGGLCLTLYHGLVYYVADYHLHEALVCLHSESNHTCRKEAEANIKKLLMNHGKVEIHISKNRTFHSGSVSVSGITRFHVSKKIIL